MNPDRFNETDSHAAPDDYQQAWQTQSTQADLTIDADTLLSEVLHSQETFLAKIRRRDLLEVGVGLLMLAYWFYQGATSSLP
jgi:hypothetical protein